MARLTKSLIPLIATMLLLASSYLAVLVQGAALARPNPLALIGSSPSSLATVAKRSTIPEQSPDHATSLEGPPCCFAASCLSWELDNSGRILEGVCWNKKDQRGHWDKVESRLDLSNCVGNFDGVLVAAANGAYSQTCSQCSLSGTTLTCLCKTPKGTPGSKATVDLNAFVQDYNGRLKCFDYVSGGTG
ncbi:hypothetical protein GE09DRAFT_338118 [Coniochaeta sp. 2T2.1]|nr:hypothetical protein GE09DRAFT_338118 [Coniochaeta sp. 2T2.1]